MKAVILCAGQSSRMGAPKGLLRVDGVAILTLHVALFQRAGLDVVVVLGPQVDAHLAVIPLGVTVVLNLIAARSDMRDSAWMGLSLGGDALLTPVDVPPARPETLAALLACAGSCVPTFGGQDGHPVRLSAPHPHQRIDDRLHGVARVEVADPNCVRNLNRPDEWRAWLDHAHPRATEK